VGGARAASRMTMTHRPGLRDARGHGADAGLGASFNRDYPSGYTQRNVMSCDRSSIE